MKKLFSLKFRFWLIAVLSIGISLGAASNKSKSGTPKKVAAANQLFSSPEILRIKIEIPEHEIEILKKYQWQFGPQMEREWVKATIRDGTKVYTNVALHLKGSAGSFRPVSDNPAMTLNFDKYVDGQRFHGLTKISLNNSVQDATLLSEQFSREMFLKAGVATPRATQVLVELNGRDLGLYVMVEGFTKQFLKNHFNDADGHLYDGGFVKDVSDELALNSGDNPTNQTDRISLAAAAGEQNLTNRFEKLQKILDIDQFLTFVAMDVMLWDWDGYALNKNNWRLFQDRSTGKMVFIPHGLDQMFWKPKASIFPPMKGLVARSVLEIPEFRARYFERVKTLRENVFKTEFMTNRVREIAGRFTPVLKDKYPDIAQSEEQAVNDFIDAIRRRGESIDQQLATPIKSAEADASGFIPLSQWESKSDFGHPTLARAEIDGKESLVLGAAAGSSIGTWRAKIWLEKGNYKIEGKVKSRGIVADLGDTRGGVGLRFATGRADKYLLSDSDWVSLTHEFSLSDPLTQVEVVCEFRGTQGEAWFDAKSLRLQHLPDKK